MCTLTTPDRLDGSQLYLGARAPKHTEWSPCSARIIILAMPYQHRCTRQIQCSLQPAVGDPIHAWHGGLVVPHIPQSMIDASFAALAQRMQAWHAADTQAASFASLPHASQHTIAAA